MGSASLEHNCLFAQSKSLQGQKRRASGPTRLSQIKLNNLIFQKQKKAESQRIPLTLSLKIKETGKIVGWIFPVPALVTEGNVSEQACRLRDRSSEPSCLPSSDSATIDHCGRLRGHLFRHRHSRPVQERQSSYPKT